MAVYMVFEPPPHPKRGEGEPERFRFVRDRFSFLAFLFTPAWLVWRRLWLALIGYGVLMAAIEVLFWITRTPSSVQLAIGFFLALFFGLEAESVRRWTYLRRGWRDRGIVIADSLEAAERRFFDAWTSGLPSSAGARESAAQTARAPAAAPSPPRSYVDEVIGLFPKPEGGR